MRVPAIARWPGVIQPGQVTNAIATTMDLLPTLLTLAGVPLPKDRQLDGADQSPVLRGEKPGVQDKVFYYNGRELYAIRKGAWKMHLTTRPSYSKEPPVNHDPPLLFQLENDPSEKYNVAAGHAKYHCRSDGGSGAAPRWNSASSFAAGSRYQRKIIVGRARPEEPLPGFKPVKVLFCFIPGSEDAVYIYHHKVVFGKKRAEVIGLTQVTLREDTQGSGIVS